MAESNAERQNNFARRQRKLGRKGRKIWATVKEHEAIKKLLSELRKEHD